MGKQVDNAILAMNRAAEDAAKNAAPIFANAVKGMSFSDALSILRGSDDAATTYLKQKTSASLTEAFRPVTVERIAADCQSVLLGDLFLTPMTTPGHTAGALSWRWEACAGAVCRTIVYADSLSPISNDSYRFSAHPADLAAFRASLAKIAASRCEILLTPHPSASNMKERMVGSAPLFDQQGCKDYAAKRVTALDKRLAEEAAQ